MATKANSPRRWSIYPADTAFRLMIGSTPILVCDVEATKWNAIGTGGGSLRCQPGNSGEQPKILREGNLGMLDGRDTITEVCHPG
jgi:hypothetical protein